ncbi:MAG: hypothetical protein JJ850_07360 [Kordiimonadaceae bacterium]|nr:hypothetical protein [Kordiimonadaceae bacterium]MBO6567852.1 hypothetical protein [Kordiimonadaceae bacterium]MBO6964418.1 hypothetical protein [Kordiimonadaceae bacterium]
MQFTLFKRIILPFLIGCAVTGAASASGKPLAVPVSGGVELSAQFFEAAGPGPAVMLLSMCDPTTSKTQWVGVAERLQAKGIHSIIFDYRGFGDSGGEMPQMLRTVEQAMVYWRENWMGDVRAVYDTLARQPGVDTSRLGIGGASCGVFMGLEFGLGRDNVQTFVSMGGPSDQLLADRLSERDDLPLLIVSGNEGPALRWSDEIFAASNHLDTRITKYKRAMHGTNVFVHNPDVQDQVADWFETYLR